MSLAMSIKRVRKPFANGCDREVFYSKRYDVVIKKPKKNSWNGDDSQFYRELRIFNAMTEEEKKIFPIVMIDEVDKVIVMKRCKKLSNLEYMTASGLDFRERVYEDDKEVFPNCQEFIDFIKKYRVCDLHIDNLGTYNGNLVILDAGYGDF